MNDLREGELERSLNILLEHPACSQITRLNIGLIFPDHEHTDFKSSLIKILQNNQVLEYLHVCGDYDINFQEYPAVFQNGNLPRLRMLDLGSTRKAVFTLLELKLWGDAGGWSRLFVLVTGSMDCFRCFVGRAAGIESLFLHTYNGMEELDSIFKSAGPIFPFPKLWHLFCEEKDIANRLDFKFALPAMLQDIPKLTSFMIQRDENIVESPGSKSGFPTAQHIREIRRLCPDLLDLRLEVSIGDSFSDWPFDVFDELCQFHKALALNLLISNYSSKSSRILGDNPELWYFAHRMMQKRKQLGLHVTSPFRIGMRIMVDGERLSQNDDTEVWYQKWQTPLGVRTWPFPGRDLLLHFMYVCSSDMRLRIVKVMSTEELLRAKVKYFYGVPFWRRRRVARELKRRKRDTVKEDIPPDFATLFDSWMEQDH